MNLRHTRQQMIPRPVPHSLPFLRHLEDSHYGVHRGDHEIHHLSARTLVACAMGQLYDSYEAEIRVLGVRMLTCLSDTISSKARSIADMFGSLYLLRKIISSLLR